jgi:hypothetical protein
MLEVGRKESKPVSVAKGNDDGFPERPNSMFLEDSGAVK